MIYANHKIVSFRTLFFYTCFYISQCFKNSFVIFDFRIIFLKLLSNWLFMFFYNPLSKRHIIFLIIIIFEWRMFRWRIIIIIIIFIFFFIFRKFITIFFLIFLFLVKSFFGVTDFQLLHFILILLNRTNYGFELVHFIIWLLI